MHKKNWKQIRTHIIRGKFVDIFHIRITKNFDIRPLLHGIFRDQSTAFKINLAFGFVLKNINTGEMRYYYPSQNGFVLEKPFVVTNHDDLNDLLEVLAKEHWMEEIRQQKPNSQWRIVKVCCVGIYIFKVLHVPIGRGGGEGILPCSLKENRGLDALEKNKNTGKVYDDNLCYFRCLARHKGFDLKNLEKKTKSLLVDYLKMIPEEQRESFEGVKMGDLPNLDHIFGIHTFVYSLETTGRPVASLIHRPNKILKKEETEEAMKLNLHCGHFSYIKCMKKYCKSFVCARCGYTFPKDHLLTRHERTCEAKVKKVYPGGVYTPTKTIFQKIEEEGIHVPEELKYAKYFATYDGEVYFPSSPNLPNKKPKLEFTAEHYPLSIGIASNVPGYKEGKCFIVKGEGEEHAKQLVQQFVTYLNEISDQAYVLEQERYADLKRLILDTLTREKEEEDSHDGEEVGFDGESEEEEEDEETEEDKQFIDDEEQETEDPSFYREVDLLRDTTPPSTSTTTTSSDPPKSRRKTAAEKLLQQLEEHLRTLPVFGFNSGSYDLNVLKRYMISPLLKHGIQCIKRNQTYMSLQTERLRFLDVCNFVAPGTSYAKFLKAYECTQEKGFFPYEWMDDLEKLDHPSLPSHQAFHSNLRGENITEEDYQHCQAVWKEKGMRTMRDFLVWYQMMDVLPFVEAVTKMKSFWMEQKIDMFQSISLPGLAFKFEMGFLEKDNLHLSVFDSPLLYDLFHNNMVGGPAIIFKRYAEAKNTPIRDTDKICQKVVGYDANALYLWALSQPMPVGLYTHWKPVENDRFKPTVPIKEADEWLAWVESTQGVTLRTHLNNSEKRLGDRQLPVDGYDATNNTPYQFMGCYWHGCPICKDPHKKHPTRGGTYGEIYDTTMKNVKYLEEEGYQPVVMWECQWNKLKQTHPDIDQFLNKQFPGRKGTRKSKEQLLEDVRHGELFGAVEVDIEVPDPLRPKFAEMTPIFKNAEIKLEDIGDHMRDHAQENGCMPQPRQALIGSYRGDKILLATPLLQFYLEQGLVVTHIYRAIQWKPDPCFERFGDFVSEARRAGDRGGSPIVAETAKLVGNAGYGRFIMDVSRHDDVAYTQDEHKVSRMINSFYFKNVQEIDDTLYEVKTMKKKLAMKLPIQIGFFVYQYAKLRMLQFHYQFLDHFLDRSDYELLEMDTDSAYMALAGSSLESLVKPELQEEFRGVKNSWLPRTGVHAAYDKRTPGLFKVEWQGDGFCGLNSKTYYCWGPTDKISCKGISKRNNDITKDVYLRVLQTKQTEGGINKGFRIVNHRMLTYSQFRDGFSYFYPKRKVLADGVSTVPLDI